MNDDKKIYASPLDIIREGRRLGRPRGAEYTPIELCQRFVDYLEFMRSRVWMRADVVKSGFIAGTIFEIPTQAPLQLSGFLLFAGMGKKAFEALRLDEDYEDAIDIIDNCIATQQIEGAMVGAYNANLVARVQKLGDKVDTDATIKVEQITGMIIT